MANDIEYHGHYGQQFSQIWPQYGHFFNEFCPYFQFLLDFMWQFLEKFQIGKEILQNVFLKFSIEVKWADRE